MNKNINKKNKSLKTILISIISLILFISLTYLFIFQEEESDEILNRNLVEKIECNPLDSSFWASFTLNEFKDIDDYTKYKICSLKDYSKVIEDVSLIDKTFIANNQVRIDEETHELFYLEEIYLYNAIKKNDSSYCNNIKEDILLREYCKAFIDKNGSTCENNEFVEDFCDGKKDPYCENEVWKNECVAIINEDKNMCRKIDDLKLSDQCVINIDKNIAIQKKDISLCKGTLLDKVECEIIIDNEEFFNRETCLDEYYFFEAKNTPDFNICEYIIDSYKKENCFSCFLESGDQSY